MEVNEKRIKQYIKEVETYVKAFIQSFPIATGGALARPKLSYYILEESDIELVLQIPYTSCNKIWANSALDILNTFRKYSPYSPDRIALSTDKIKIHINIHTCDPD